MGRFIVNDNLPPHLAQGMFAKPGSYDMIMRYSSLTPKIVPDNVPAPRGIGIKIFGVEGEKLWGEDKKTQDWTFNNYPILELRDPKTTNEIADSLEKVRFRRDRCFDHLLTSFRTGTICQLSPKNNRSVSMLMWLLLVANYLANKASFDHLHLLLKLMKITSGCNA